jgi:ribosome-binding protein aMBF1 (putative translation factor)
MSFVRCGRARNAQIGVWEALRSYSGALAARMYALPLCALAQPARAPDMSGRVDSGSPDVARAFGTVLRAARARQGLSQERLAYCSGLGRSYPSLLERGLRQPTVGTLIRLSQVLRIAPLRLLEETLAYCDADEVASESEGTLRGIDRGSQS